AQGQRGRGGAEDADADGLGAVPEEDDAASEGEVVAAIMPPSEVRPVGAGTGRQPKVVRERHDFFFTSRRWHSTAPSPRQRTQRSGLRSSSRSSCVVASRKPVPLREQSLRTLKASTLARVRSRWAANSSARRKAPSPPTPLPPRGEGSKGAPSLPTS